ncbi:hypothetical protein [Streptomyces sp. NPDC049555]|uniref:hypothetical protein n=1 Tax=Streptomyces sp. NPDC049555 TaxID=3154930 RepID=UPI00343D3640
MSHARPAHLAPPAYGTTGLSAPWAPPGCRVPLFPPVRAGRRGRWRYGRRGRARPLVLALAATAAGGVVTLCSPALTHWHLG